MKIQKQLNTEAGGEGGANATIAETAPMDATALQAIFSEEGIKGEEAVSAATTIEKTEPITATTEKTKTTKTEPAAEEGFVLKDEPKPIDQKSWKSIATAFNLDVEKDDIESVKTAYNNHIETLKKEAAESVKDVTLEAELKNIDPEAAMLFDYMKSGGKLENWQNPLKPFDNMLEMDDETLVREAEKLRKTPQEEIDSKVVEMIDDGTLSDEAKELRVYVKQERSKFQQQIVDKRKDSFQKTYKAENEAIKAALDKQESLYDIPLTAQIKQSVANKISEYREKFKNDPTLFAKAILQLELGDQAKGLIAKKAREEQKSELNKKIFNLEDVPGKQNGSASRTDKNFGQTLAEQFEAKLNEERANI